MRQTKFLRWVLRLLLFAPLLWWIALGLQGGLGVEPVAKLNTETGYVTLVLLLINLVIGICLALKKNWPAWTRWFFMERRWLGVAAGLYLLGHVFFYFAKEGFLPTAFSQIFTKNYLTAGFIAAVVVWLLTLTSNNFSQKLMGRKWKFLHRLIHVVSFAVLAHLFLIEKANMLLLGLMTLPLLPFQLFRLGRFLKTKVESFRGTSRKSDKSLS